MANILDFLGTSTQTNKDYLSENPYYIGGQQLLKLGMQPIDGGTRGSPVSTTSQFLAPFLSSLLGGTLMSYGKRDAAQQQFGDYAQNPLLKGFTNEAAPYGVGQTPEEDAALAQAYHPYADPNNMPKGWSSVVGKNQLEEAGIVKKMLLDREVHKQTLADELQKQVDFATNPDVRAAKVADETALIDERNKKDRTIKSKDTATAALGGIESLDRLVNMVDTLPKTMLGRFAQGVSPLTNSTNFFDDQVKTQAAALAKQLEGRVNETVLKTYTDSLARHEGDSPEDIKARLVNAQLWLSRIAQGDKDAPNIDALQFAIKRGVNPVQIGIAPPSQAPTMNIQDMLAAGSSESDPHVGMKQQVNKVTGETRWVPK